MRTLIQIARDLVNEEPLQSAMLNDHSNRVLVLQPFATDGAESLDQYTESFYAGSSEHDEQLVFAVALAAQAAFRQFAGAMLAKLTAAGRSVESFDEVIASNGDAPGVAMLSLPRFADFRKRLTADGLPQKWVTVGDFSGILYKKTFVMRGGNPVGTDGIAWRFDSVSASLPEGGLAFNVDLDNGKATLSAGFRVTDAAGVAVLPA